MRIREIKKQRGGSGGGGELILVVLVTIIKHGTYMEKESRSRLCGNHTCWLKQ